MIRIDHSFNDEDSATEACATCGAPGRIDYDTDVTVWACGRSEHVRDSNEYACNRIAGLSALVALLKPKEGPE